MAGDSTKTIRTRNF